MDRSKNKVAISKSSNGAIASKSEAKKNKKSRSNAEIQPLLLKKRGMYVEKNATVSINAQRPDSPKKGKTPVIPRPGKKGFLTSVLTILSKSTTGTQYPEPDSKINRRYERVKHKDNKTNEPSKKKPKYKSKTLNDQTKDLEQFTVLQSRKDMISTPSNISSNQQEAVKWSDFLPPLVKRTETKDEMEKSIYAEGIAKEIFEGLQMNEEGKLKTDIPHRNEAGLYNFFVDLLETTFSVYNVKPDYSAPVSSVASSKVAFEMDETVAKRLQFANSPEDLDNNGDINEKVSHNYFCTPDNRFSVASNDSQETAKPKPPLKVKEKRNDLNSFPKTKSDIKRPNKKTNHKRELLNILKTELSVNVATFEEPQSLYEALRVMAKNKRKCEKTTHFDSPRKITDGGSPDCFFKRRKVLTFSKSNAKKAKTDDQFLNTFRPEYKDEDYSEDDTVLLKTGTKYAPSPSTHSLEVYGFEYEAENRRSPLNPVKEIVLTYHSTPTQSERDYNPNEAIIKYSQSGNSGFLYSE